MEYWINLARTKTSGKTKEEWPAIVLMKSEDWPGRSVSSPYQLTMEKANYIAVCEKNRITVCNKTQEEIIDKNSMLVIRFNAKTDAEALDEFRKILTLPADDEAVTYAKARCHGVTETLIKKISGRKIRN